MPLSGTVPAGQQKIRSQLERELRPALLKAGYVLQRVEQKNTPVDTGRLRAGWTVKEPGWTGSTLHIQIGDWVVYARPVNARGKHKGFADKSLQEAKSEITQILHVAFKKAMQGMWVKV